MKANTLNKLWRVIEDMPGLATVEAEWRYLVGGEFRHLEPFLRVEKDIALSYPNPNGGIPYSVVMHRSDDIVGVCPETGDAIPLKRQQLIVYRLDPQQLALRVAGAVGLSSAVALECSEERLYHIGSLRPNGVTVSAFLLLPRHRDEIFTAKAVLVASKQTPFLLLVPSLRWVDGNTHVQLRSMGCGVLSLADSLTVADDGNWTIGEETILATLPDQPMVEEPLVEREMVVLVAMLELKALDSDSRQKTESIAARGFGPSVGYETLKTVINGLKSRGLIETVRKKGGGCYLTEVGRRRAEKLHTH